VAAEDSVPAGASCCRLVTLVCRCGHATVRRACMPRTLEASRRRIGKEAPMEPFTPLEMPEPEPPDSDDDEVVADDGLD
jgi:hypothetical protein